MASTAVTWTKHDVFINFRGKDTRKNFVSHLLSALERNGIDAFTDKGLKGGEVISPTLSKRISDSQVSVVVFSVNYADSRWCLDELVRIMECHEVNGQTVLPVFLQGVEPTHVRNQTGSFRDCFTRLVQDARYAGKEQSWRCALKQAANLSGWASDQISEGKIVQKLLEHIQSVLGQMSSGDSYRCFVGIERVEEVESFLSSPEVRCLGVWGMGGSGKTTLAEKIYHCVSKKFDGACYIENVSEYVERHGLSSLRRHLLSQLLQRHDPNESPYVIFCSDIQRKLRGKKYLVILDDISNASQLHELIADCTLYCLESKVIATSRDKQILKNACDKVYEVKKLNYHESLQLLKLHILKQRQPTPDQMELLKDAVKYTQGLPLALVILGRNLFDKDVNIWKSELAKLSDIPDLEIMKILRTSYDELEDTEKNIFLDIACLMEGWNKDHVERIHDACGFYPIRGIARLADKALITISDHTLRMHALVQQMGQHIASREGRPSRLWRNIEIEHVLTKNQGEIEGMGKIEVISMDLSKAVSIKLRSRVFKKLTGLRILRFHNASTPNNMISLPKGLEYLPDELRYLRWDLYPLPSLPPHFNPENLVELHMVDSHLVQLWTGEVEPCLPSLKYVDLSGSKKLTALPNFRNALKLETLLLRFCENLKAFPASIQHLVELNCIDLCSNRSLTEFPEFSQLTKLETLWLMRCSGIRDLPQLPQNLIWLDLSFTKIKELPTSIQSLSELKYLVLNGCEELERLPDNIGELKNVKQLDVSGCPKLSILPANLGSLMSLKILITEGSPLNSLPETVNRLSSLAILSCSGYKGDALPPLKGLVSLNQLLLKRGEVKSLPEDIKYLTNLSRISLYNCTSIRSIPELPPSLRLLDASNCTSLQKYTRRSSRSREYDHRLGLRSMPERFHMDFINCFSLKQDAKKEIWIDFWLRVKFVLVPLVEKMSNKQQTIMNLWSISANVCVPGNELPEWFKYSKVGSSLQLKTNLRRRLDPLRFIFCAVVAFPPSFDYWPCHLKMVCKCVTTAGETLYSSCRYMFKDEPDLSQTAQTILWCDHYGLSDQFYFNEAVFLFSTEIEIEGSDTEEIRGLVVKCGVTPVGRTFGSKWLPMIQDGNSLEVKERASPVKRSQTGKRGNDEEEEQQKMIKRSKWREHFMVASQFPMSVSDLMIERVFVPHHPAPILRPSPQIKHDVFVNFRGKDTRKNFTSHLRAALERNGIDAFTDKGLKAGEEISPTLSSKISESQVSVVVFSQNYADSRWCLDELVKIMECKEVNGQAVLPVFLQGVEPTHVRNQTSAFGVGFGRLIQNNRYADKEESWRHALKQASDLSGWASDQISEGKIIEKLLNRVQSILGQLSSDDSQRHFIGIERVEEVESFMSLPNVRCIGIWGMGGSGKTTLVEKLYLRISKKFDGACYIENVREFAERHELNRLRKYLLSQLLGKYDPNEGPPVIFRGDIQRKLRRKRVLVILDDVSDASQLIELIGDCSFYCPESKIIATSRDKQVLKNVCDKVYEVQKLNDHEALQLLKIHIFKQRQPTPDQTELLKEAIKYTQGLPLALVVLGRNLFDKDITIWKSELAKLSDIPDLQITKILRTTFDGLEDTEKSIFLDIACLMDGWSKDRVESILDACGFYAVRGIARLVDKALVTVSNHMLRMHDLIKQMGQHIAFHEGIKQTGRPSRLWRYKEVAELLTKNQETEETRNIEVISMDLSKAASIELKSRVFKKMTGVRVLRFHGAFHRKNKISLPEGLKYLPDGLLYLRWDLYPLSSLPPRFNPESLVELCMVNSHLKQLWTCEVEPCLPNLKSVDLSGSKDLITLPNFSNALKLETLSVPFCKNLKGMPDSIQHLVELKYLVLHGNKSLSGVPEYSQLTKLEILSLMGCSKVRDIPQLPRNLISLNLSFTKIKALPPSIQGLTQLEDLLLCGCEELEGLPGSINELKNLKELNIGGCSNLSTLPANFGDLKSLEMLITEGSPLNNLPESIYHLGSLTFLCCSGYKGNALPSLKTLVLLHTLYLLRSNLKSLPEDIKCLEYLRKIYLSNCKSLSYIPELPSSLRYLDASNCTSLQKYTHRSFGINDLKIRTRSIPEHMRLKFDNCFNLEQEARSNIWRDFWQRVQFILVPSVEMSSEEIKSWHQSSSETRPRLAAHVCFPGNEVPTWFKYSRIGSNFQVKTNFRRFLDPLRFIFCMVVAVPNNFGSWKGRTLKVTCQCKTKVGEHFHSKCSYTFEDESILFQTEHTILWCDHFGPSQFYLNEATFQFSAEMLYISSSSSLGHGVPLDDAAIVKCGVTPVGRTFGTKWLPAIQDDIVEQHTKPEKRRRVKDIEQDLLGHKRKKKRSMERHNGDQQEERRQVNIEDSHTSATPFRSEGLRS